MQADGGIEEEWRWGPSYYRSGMLCAFGVFPQYVALVFFKGSLLKDPLNILIHKGAKRFNRAARFRSAGEVDEAALLTYVKEAVMINEMKIKTPPPSKTLRIPADLDAALSVKMIARENFLKMPYTHRNEYVAWLETARRQTTRDHRIMEIVKRSLLNLRPKEKGGFRDSVI
jgi:uncharacterized protein YdeI (YjbR/CyaY-like superfamily)